jgi:hypothetical protein
VLSQRHRTVELLFGCYVEQHGGAFYLAAGFVGYNAPGCEEVRRSYPSQKPPVGSVGCEADGSAEHEALSRLLEGAVSEVWGGQDFPGSAGV